MISTQEKYATRLSAGLGLVDETRALLTIYEAGMDNSALVDKALQSGIFPNIAARRLRNIVAECFSPRYLKTGVAALLKPLSDKLNSSEFVQLLLIHTALSNKVLLDFIVEIYWSKYISGQDLLTAEDAHRFVENAVREGKTQKPWSEITIKRQSSYLLGCCADYGLLSATRSANRTIQPVRLHQTTALYLAHWLHFSGLGDNAIINHDSWKLFGLEPHDVRDELKKLAKHNWMIVQSAADVTRISWQLKTMDEVVNVITEARL